MKRLTIISHTEHYLRSDGTLVGLGSTVTEINNLLEIFDEITHVAMLYKTAAPQNALPYSSEKISFIALPVVGGKRFIHKLNVLWLAPKILNIIHKSMTKSSYFQFRAPTGIGVYVIPFLVFFNSNKGWFKYAGNWGQENAPIAYRFQRFLLKLQSRKVTINGVWENQPKQCLSFENPCITIEELEIGKKIRKSKSLQFPIDICFVGRMESAKGVDLIIETIAGLNIDLRSKIGEIHMVGTGERVSQYQDQCKAKKLPFVFHGLLSRAEVSEIYKKSHALLLPSLSEGFPKVITEAMNYGCVPIISDVSSISQYVKHNKNGYLMQSIDTASLELVLNQFFYISETDYTDLLQYGAPTMERFSYSYYNNRIMNDILQGFI